MAGAGRDFDSDTSGLEPWLLCFILPFGRHSDDLVRYFNLQVRNAKPISQCYCNIK